MNKKNGKRITPQWNVNYFAQSSFSDSFHLNDIVSRICYPETEEENEK